MGARRKNATPPDYEMRTAGDNPGHALGPNQMAAEFEHSFRIAKPRSTSAIIDTKTDMDSRSRWIA